MGYLRFLIASAIFALPVALLQTIAYGQETRGSIVGRVVDASGGVIPGVAITVTNTGTNVSVSTESNERALYDVPYLIPGIYSIRAEYSGFKRFTRDGIEIRIADRITIDIPMELGDVTEQVTVTAETPLLESATSSWGQVIDRRRLSELPIAHGNPYLLMSLSAGVVHTQNPGLDRPFAPTHIVGYAIDGVRANRSEITLDGTPNTVVNHRWGRGDLMAGYTPPADIVQEMKVQTSAFDASVGHTQGGVTSITLKSGSNDFHGAVSYSKMDPALDANLFFANSAGQGKGDFGYDRYGGVVTGPIVKDRTFFSYGYERIKEGVSVGASYGWGTLTVPTELERKGDFSQLLNVGPSYQIYDPATRVPVAGGLFEVQPLANNIIPASRIEKTATNVLEYFSLPNAPGTADGSNNLIRVNDLQVADYYNHIVRVDHNFSSNHRIFGRFNTYKTDYSESADWFRNIASGGVSEWPQHAASLDDVYNLTPSTLLNFKYGFYRLKIFQGPKRDSVGFDLTSLGFPSYLNDASGEDQRAFPAFQIEGYEDTPDNWWTHNHQSHTFEANITSIQRNHTLRFGADARNYRTFHYELGNSSTGAFSFGTDWTKGPFNTSSGSPKGQGLASFLLGLPTDGRVDRNASYAQNSNEYSLYFHDDWKVTPRLTLNLGLRWEVESPVTERFDRSVRGYDFTTPNPLNDAARANYAQNPIPEISVNDFRFIGGLTFAGVGGQPRNLWNRDKNNFMPRLGFAYALNDKTVLRGGYGIFYGPLGGRRIDVIQDGFSTSTNLIPSLDNGLTFAATLSDPFPGGIQQPRGAADGLLTFAGRGIQFFEENPRAPRQQRWQFSIQRELPQRFLVEVGYVGNRGDSMETNHEYTALPLNYLSTKNTRDTETINYLSEQVPNPFAGLLPGTALSTDTVSKAFLLSGGAFSGFTNVNALDNQGYSRYHGLVAKVERRFSDGFTFNLSYTWSKNLEALNRLNGQFDQLEYVISDQDRPHRLAPSAVWELPFGRGRKFLNTGGGAVDKILGGWQVQGVYTWQSGPALGWDNVFFRGSSVHDITLPAGQRTPEQWLNTNAGFERDSQFEPGFNFRTWPSRLNDVRGDGVKNWDLSVIKNTSITERFQLQFRAEFLNAFNHANFDTPDASPTSSSFGQVFNQRGYPRRIQLGLKLLF